MSPFQPLRLRLGCLLLGWAERLLSGVAASTAEVIPARPGTTDANSGASHRGGSDLAATRSAASVVAAAQPPSTAARRVHGPQKPLGTAAQSQGGPARPAAEPRRDPAADKAADRCEDGSPDQPDGAPLTPALRRPIPIEKAVLHHDLRVLRREAADALAALGAAHALVSSARLAQVQELRQQLGEGHVSEDTLLSLAADYQGWVNDQVRLFDALSLVMRMRIPAGRVLEQVDPAMRPQACSHLEMLCLEYERQQLNQRFPRESSNDKDVQG
jgi:hypothetical protein